MPDIKLGLYEVEYLPNDTRTITVEVTSDDLDGAETLEAAIWRAAEAEGWVLNGDIVSITPQQGV